MPPEPPPLAKRQEKAGPKEERQSKKSIRALSRQGRRNPGILQRLPGAIYQQSAGTRHSNAQSAAESIRVLSDKGRGETLRENQVLPINNAQAKEQPL